MQFLSEDAGGYLRTFKPGVLLFIAVAVIRLFLQPVGVPIAIGGMVFSISIVMLLLILGYAIYFGIFDGRIADPIVSAALWVILYTVVANLFMAGSYYAGIENYYTDASHIGASPNVPAHVWAHIRATPIMLVMASVIALLFFGAAKLGSRLIGGPRSTAAA